MPSAPEGPLEMSDISERTVTISWKLPKSMGGLDLTGYVIQRRDRNKYSWLHVDNVKPNIRSYCIQNLVEGKEYLFRVLAQNDEGLSEPLQSADAVLMCRPTGFWLCLLLYDYLL